MRSSRAIKTTRRAVAIALVAILASGCKRAQLPDADSPAAKLYVARCGNCHAPYNPHEMTADNKITFASDGYKMDMKMAMNQGGRPMNMTQHMEARYVGPCSK